MPRPSHLLGWLGHAQVMPRTPPPPSVLDQLFIAPLICHQDDELQGIGTCLDAPDIDPDAPTYALR